MRQDDVDKINKWAEANGYHIPGGTPEELWAFPVLGVMTARIDKLERRIAELEKKSHPPR